LTHDVESCCVCKAQASRRSFKGRPSLWYFSKEEVKKRRELWEYYYVQGHVSELREVCWDDDEDLEEYSLPVMSVLPRVPVPVVPRQSRLDEV